MPVTAEDLAQELGTSRRTLAAVIERDTGQQFADWIAPFFRTSHDRDGDAPGMKFWVTLESTPADALRRRAAAARRDPRAEARRILEAALAE